MTRTYALLRLLDHGALTARQIEEITRWTKKQVQKTIAATSSNGRIFKENGAWKIWK